MDHIFQMFMDHIFPVQCCYLKFKGEVLELYLLYSQILRVFQSIFLSFPFFLIRVSHSLKEGSQEPEPRSRACKIGKILTYATCYLLPGEDNKYGSQFTFGISTPLPVKGC